ncbi:MAG: hypothetical protein IJR14_00585 [Synergistaceae bacterium]|nr:hypothetical protein [Synergistaceae bacterium]
MKASKRVAAVALLTFLFPSSALAAPRGGRGGRAAPPPPPPRRERRVEGPRPVPHAPRLRDEIGRDGRRPAYGPGFRPAPPRDRRYRPEPRWDAPRRSRRRRRHDTIKGIAIGIGIFALLAAMADRSDGDRHSGDRYETYVPYE